MFIEKFTPANKRCSGFRKLVNWDKQDSVATKPEIGCVSAYGYRIILELKDYSDFTSRTRL